MKRSIVSGICAVLAFQGAAAHGHAAPERPNPPNDSNKAGENWDRTPQGDPKWLECELIAQRNGKDEARICFWFATMMDRKNRH